MPHQRSETVVSIQLPASLSSHNPMDFSSQPTLQPVLQVPCTRYVATRIQCVSNNKLRLEGARQEPRLSNLLGHISIYENVREWRRAQALQELNRLKMRPVTKQLHKLEAVAEVQECQHVSWEEIPHQQRPRRQRVTKSFEDFQTAIKVQMATMERIKAAAEDLRRMTSDDDAIEADVEESHAGVEEYESTSDTDSDYDSHDGDADWQDEEDGADSEDSMTDPESVNSQCCSPVEEDTEERSDYFGQPATAISVHF